jgi:ubiquitin carboxyl-terminal hydrolase 8
MAATHSTITILYQDQIAFHSLAIDHPSSPQISHRIHIFLFQQVSSSQQKAKKHYRTFRILVAPPKTRICVLVNLFPVAETPINNGISLIGLPREIVQARFFLRRHDLQASLTSSPAAIDMSMGATLGPPPGPPIFERGHTTEPHRNGFGGNGNTSKKSSDRVFPHIDDLVNVRPDVGIHTPMRKLLHAAEDSAKNAETHLDFRRPDYALKEYINALTIVVDIIPRHKEFPDLRTSELYRVFLGVQKRIMAQNAKFEDVKKKIKENNAANGIKPEKEQGFATGRTTVANGSSGMSRADSPQVVNARKVDSSSQSESSQNHRQPRNGESSLDNLQLVRVKPIPGPKPDALHGKSIPHSVSNGIQRISNPPLEDSEARFPPLEDLEARFARLRHTEPRKDAVQDPRIRTRPLGSLDLSDHNRQSLDQTSQLQYKPSGPRDMPKVSSGAPHPSKTPFNLNIPVLLQQPAAIYSPDRSSTEVRNSIPPRPTARNKMSTLTHSTPYNPGAAYKSPHNPMPTTPSTTITSHQLDILLQDEAKSQSLLLVDIRARRDFDEGHIMAPYIICIEPTILRENCSAVDLEEALILAPDYERQLYQNRHQFEKIVYYDQSSISNRYLTVTSNVEEMYLKRFHKAVWEYEYDKRLKGPPLLLIGGLDIWQDVNPQLKLATSTTLPAIEELGPQISIQSTGANKQVSSRLDPTDETSFANEMIDFSKRFPPVLESMSMTDESQLNGTKQVSSTRIGGFGNQTGRSPIPARPQPVLVSGGRNGDWRLGKIGGSKYGSSRIPAKLAHSNRKTGLKNFGNTCYMNSIYQALSATTWLPRYLCEGDFDELGPPPRKEDELSRPPQLMSRNLAYLFAALWSGQHPYISPHQLRVSIATGIILYKSLTLKFRIIYSVCHQWEWLGEKNRLLGVISNKMRRNSSIF